jgi:hypothetical protein
MNQCYNAEYGLSPYTYFAEIETMQDKSRNNINTFTLFNFFAFLPMNSKLH